MTSPTLPRDENEALTRELAWAMSELVEANRKNGELAHRNVMLDNRLKYWRRQYRQAVKSIEWLTRRLERRERED